MWEKISIYYDLPNGIMLYDFCFAFLFFITPKLRELLLLGFHRIDFSQLQIFRYIRRHAQHLDDTRDRR
jgi:hypothetical protein